MPLRAQASAVTWAANGVDLRDPLKPAEPADSQAITLPSRSVSVTIVLLKLVLMCAWPTAMFFLTLRRARGRRGAGMVTSAGPPAPRPDDVFRHPASRDRSLRSLLGRLLPAGHLLAAWTLAGAGVGLGALAPDRQAAAVTQPAIAADLLEALDVLRALAPSVSIPGVTIDRLECHGNLFDGYVG